MSSTSAGPTSAEVATLCRMAQMPSISKPQLQNICVVNGLGKTGNKADLQRRIVNLIKDCEQRRDSHTFSQVKQSLYNNAPVVAVAQPVPNINAHPSIYSPTTAAAQSAYTNMPANNGYASNGYGAMPPRLPGIPNQSFQYKSSPFYEMKARIGDVRICEAMAQHRQTVNIYVRTQDHPTLHACVTDPTMRVMVFCAAANQGPQDISFPHQSELKINGGEVKANLRGLKNKPGSTKPVDITALLRLKPPTYSNNVEFTYALTTKKHYLGIYVCKITSIEGLVEQIKTSKRIAKASVIQELAKKASDPDVVATSQLISLKDPLSYMRLTVPCRGLQCGHIQCFDATAYLQLQEQGPQWLCPICNNPAPFEHLAVDGYVMDILTNTPQTVEQVTIEPDGKWFVPPAQGDDKNSARHDTSFVDDDDLVIAQVSSRHSTTATPNRSGYAYSTPAQESSREGSSMPRSATSSKRPAAEVIDLTLSDDEDEPPAKRPKNQFSGYPGWPH